MAQGIGVSTHGNLLIRQGAVANTDVRVEQPPSHYRVRWNRDRGVVTDALEAQRDVARILKCELNAATLSFLGTAESG